MTPEIQVNGKTVEVDLTGAETLSDIIAIVTDKSFEPDETIVNAIVNDQKMDKASLASMADVPASEISSVSLSTVKSPQAKTAELLNEMGNYLNGLSSGIGEVADVFRVGSPEKANAMLLDALGGLSAFVELIQATKMVSKTDLSIISKDGVTMESLEERLLGVLRDFQKGQEDNDWVTVADLLEYELSPLLEGWISLIPEMEKALLGNDH